MSDVLHRLQREVAEDRLDIIRELNDEIDSLYDSLDGAFDTVTYVAERLENMPVVAYRGRTPLVDRADVLWLARKLRALVPDPPEDL